MSTGLHYVMFILMIFSPIESIMQLTQIHITWHQLR